MLSPRNGGSFSQRLRPSQQSGNAAPADVDDRSASQLHHGGVGHRNSQSSHDAWTDDGPDLASINPQFSTELANAPTPPAERAPQNQTHAFIADGPAKKRARTSDTSETPISSTRKRAVTACRLCRTRKTKCSNTRPKCKFCTDNNADCVYEDASTTSLYAFDPATCGSLILERLDQVLDRLDFPSRQHVPAQQQATPEGISTIQQQPVSNTSPRQSTNSYDPGQIDPMDEEYMRIPSSRTTCDVVLQWPIFNNRYPTNFLLEPLFEAGLELDSDDESETGMNMPISPRKSGKGNNITFVGGEENVLRLVDNFIAVVHTKNPILDINSLQKYARRLAEDGPGWDGKSCLVLLACALGAIAKPFSESLYNASLCILDGTSSSITNSLRDLEVAEGYYGLARKRIGLLGNTIIRSQCYLLSGVYLIEIRVEISLPESSLADLRYPDPFPSPPAEDQLEQEDLTHEVSSQMDFASPSSSSDRLAFRSRRVDSMGETQQQSWYYYLIEIALRRIGNRILNTLNQNKHFPGFGVPVVDMLRIAIDFENELLQWQEKIPLILSYDYENLCNIPTNELAYMIRARTIEIKIGLYRPFLYYAIHYPADDPYQQIIQPFVEKALQHGSAHIRGLEVRHRHHGTWYALRTATAAALCTIAAAKCGHVTLLETWVDDVKMQISLLRYWGGEGPDLAKAGTVLQEMLDEVL